MRLDVWKESHHRTRVEPSYIAYYERAEHDAKASPNAIRKKEPKHTISGWSGTDLPCLADGFHAVSRRRGEMAR